MRCAGVRGRCRDGRRVAREMESLVAGVGRLRAGEASSSPTQPELFAAVASGYGGPGQFGYFLNSLRSQFHVGLEKCCRVIGVDAGPPVAVAEILDIAGVEGGPIDQVG